MNGLVLDAGNSIIKSKTFSGGEVTFPHAMLPISESQYLDVLRSYTDGPPDDFMRINDRCYVVGESAERYGVSQHERGPARYGRDYVGILAAASLAKHYVSSCEVAIFASHPPGHVDYAGGLMSSLLGSWEIEVKGRNLRFFVSYCNTFDEPSGGLMNALLTEDGKGYANPALRGQRILVIDIGGGTTDWIETDETGQIDYGVAHTETLGIDDIIDRFSQAFKARYKNVTKSANRLAPERIREALNTGVFRGGGDALDCHEEAEQARNTLVNLVLRETRSRYGGGFNYDAILLTGGGCGLLHQHIAPELENKNIHLAAAPDELHLANVRGGLKLWRLYKAIGVIS